jgi:minor fimbrial subunit
MDPRGLAAGRPVNRELPAGGRRHLTVNGKVVARPCTVSTVNATVELGDLYTFSLIGGLGIGLAQRGAGSQQLPRRYLAGDRHLQRNGGQHRLLQKPGNGGQYSARAAGEDGTTLNNGSSQSVQVDEASQSARFPLQVRALTVNGGATQGTIQAVINVTYTYA